MINKSEINRLATQRGVQTATIEKDWALGHFLDAIYSQPECRENLILKGGTCLRKCRFPNFRFSEDLDFTSRDQTFVFDRALLERIVSLITFRTGMPLHIDSLEELYYQDKLTGYAARVKYWGADHRKDQQPPEPSRWLTSIKVEVILYEQMAFEQEWSSIHHPYSDALSENASRIPIYSIPEVLAEKIRALIQRSYTAPRDYYDIWYLSHHVENIDWQAVVEAFYRKAAYKDISFTGIEQLINEENDRLLKRAWKNSLAHQIDKKELPSYDEVRQDLLELFGQIF
jgi:predicted nucleotidyltransferase component of viral defense system